MLRSELAMMGEASSLRTMTLDTQISSPEIAVEVSSALVMVAPLFALPLMNTVTGLLADAMVTLGMLKAPVFRVQDAVEPESVPLTATAMVRFVAEQSKAAEPAEFLTVPEIVIPHPAKVQLVLLPAFVEELVVMLVAWLIQETVRSQRLKVPAPDHVLWAEVEDVRTMVSDPAVPQELCPEVSRVMVPALATLPERVTLPVPVLVQTPPAPTVTAPEVRLNVAP